MNRSYKATGINLKGVPLGEMDRLLTILTVEQGLVRVVVPGARKHKSRLAGRSSQFVVNELLIVQGKRLDKLVQAETLRSFPALSADLARLTASQYLTELVLCQALSEQPQGALFTSLVDALQALEQADRGNVILCLLQGIFRLLTLAGVAPEVQRCSLSQQAIIPDLALPDWRVGFSFVSGRILSMAELERSTPASAHAGLPRGRYPIESSYPTRPSGRSPHQPQTTLLTALELAVLQRLEHTDLSLESLAIALASQADTLQGTCLRLERVLRNYAQYHFERPIRSATLMDACYSAYGSC